MASYDIFYYLLYSLVMKLDQYVVIVNTVHSPVTRVLHFDLYVLENN